MKGRIRELARIHGVRSVRLFGSAARGNERPGSDIEVVPVTCAKPRILASALKHAIRIV